MGKRTVCCIALMLLSCAAVPGVASASTNVRVVASTPTITLLHVGDLHDGGTISVAGTGFHPHVAVQWFTCAVGVACDLVTVGNAVTDGAGSFVTTYATRRFLRSVPEIDCANTACSLVGFETPSLQSPFAVRLHFPARFPRFEYRLELNRSSPVDASGHADIGVRVRCSYITDFTILITAVQSDSSGLVVASGASPYTSVRCFPDPRRGRVVSIRVDSSNHYIRNLGSGATKVKANAIAVSTPGELPLTLHRTVELKERSTSSLLRRELNVNSTRTRSDTTHA